MTWEAGRRKENFQKAHVNIKEVLESSVEIVLLCLTWSIMCSKLSRIPLPTGEKHSMLCIQLSGSAQYIRVTSLTKYEICLSKIKYSREFGEEK